MDKLRSILAVVETPDRDAAVVEKAVVLARAFGAKVEIMLADSTQACAFSTLCKQKGFAEVTLFSMFRGAESMHDIIVRRVMDARPDIVIKAPAGSHPLRRCTAEDNDWHLANECPVPLLLVRDRPWSKPMRFAAAVDVSDSETEAVTRAILQVGGFLTLGTRGHLDVLYSERERADDAKRMALAARVAQLVREFHVGSERLQIFDGAPELTLRPLISAREYDVVLLGAVTHRPGLVASLFSLTSRLSEATNGDVLLVQPSQRSPSRAITGASLRQQRPHEQEEFV